MQNMNKNWFKTKFKEAGITQKQLVAELGMTREAAMTEFLNGGRQLTISEGFKMSQILNCQVSEIYSAIHDLKYTEDPLRSAPLDIPTLSTILEALLQHPLAKKMGHKWVAAQVMIWYEKAKREPESWKERLNEMLDDRQKEEELNG